MPDVVHSIPNLEVMKLVRNRAGLKILCDNWQQLMIGTKWACTSTMTEELMDNNTLMIPIFAVQYYWDGEGNLSSNINVALKH